MRSLLAELAKLIQKHHLNIYSVAEMTDHGIEVIHLQPANACNNSYSVAKAFTMTAIGMLQDDGQLSVQDSVFEIFKDVFAQSYDKKWEAVTIEDVIKHRAGFGCGFLDIDVDDIYQYGTDDFLQVVLSQPLAYQPGTREVYSDAAYYLLSRIVSSKTNCMLDTFLQKRLFTPLKFQEVAWSKCPKGYPMGATGLYIRTEDMVKLGWVYLNCGMYMGQSIVSNDWVRQVLACGYELHRLNDHGVYAKGGMNGQMLAVFCEARRVIAWHGYCSEDINILYDFLRQQ